MIVPQDAPKSALSSEPVTRDVELEVTTEDVLPPAYEPRSEAPPHIKPANHIVISRRLGELKDTFVLDPSLRVPHPMRARDETLHLSLSALLGEVAAVIYVVPSALGSLPSDRTRMEVTSTLGTTRLELHAPQPRAPISVSVSARLGEATLLLPRSFRGPLRISVALGEVEMSAALRAVTTKFGDGRMFVGEWTKEELEENMWAGDEAVVNSQLGTVYVGYDTEKKA